MDICVLNPFFYPYKGGTEKVLFEVYSRLAKKHNITVVTSTSSEKNKPSVEEINGIKVVRLRTFHERIPMSPMPFLLFDGLTKTLKKEMCDVYHINNRYQFFEDTVITVKGMNKKLALTIHNAKPNNIDPMTDDMGRFYDWFWGNKLIHAADIITGVSTYTINTTVPRSEHHKTHLVLNGVDSNRFRHSSMDESEVIGVRKQLGFDTGLTILTNGRLVRQKGQIYLIKAFADLVKKDNEDLNLLMIGNGMLRDAFHRIIKKERLSSRFKTIYGIGDDMLPHYYNASNLFVLPSLYEPAGLALLESLSCEIPAVITHIGGMPEIAGNNAFYIKSRDPSSIRKKIKYVLDNPKEARRIAREGRKRVIRYHNWDNIAKEYERLFLSVIRY